jgi:transposase
LLKYIKIIMMKRLLKQTVGIDVASKKLDVSLGRLDDEMITEIYAYKVFDNTEKGFMALGLWVKKQTDAAVQLRFIMEATGVYHERIARYLSDKGHMVTIVLPNKIANFFKTLEVKTITDKSMSAAIAQFGLEKNLQDWVPARKVYRQLRQVTRERDQLIHERTMVKNQLHAEETEAYPNEKSVKRIKARIKMINGQIRETGEEITAIVRNDAEVAAAATLVSSIPGIGALTAATILAETDGFKLIENKRQLTSYAGLDVKLKDSGTSVHGKPQISKRGNRYLRKVMHMPALAAIRHTDRYKAVFVRIVSRTGIKMKGVVAVQRMLLEMAYTVYKTKKAYDKDYVEKLSKEKLAEAIL